MENSIFISFFLRIFKLLQTGFVGSVFTKVCDFVYGIWIQSAVYQILFVTPYKLDIRRSLIYRIAYLPFAILNLVANKYQFNAIKSSYIISWTKEYLSFILSINTRFFGAYLIISSTCYFISRMSIDIFGIIGLIIGVLGVALNLDGLHVLKHSFIAKLVLEFIDFEIGLVKSNRENDHTMQYGMVAGALSGALMFLTHPIFAILIVVALSAIALVFQNPLYGLYMTILAVPILPTKIMAGICAVVILSTVIRNILYNHKWKLDDVGFLVISLLFIYFISALFSFTRFNGAMILVLYTIFIGFYIICIQLLTTEEIIMRCAKLFVLMGTLVSFYGILQYIFGWGVNENWIDPEVFETLTKRAYSTLENPNLLGSYLILTIMVCVGIIVTRKSIMPVIGYGACLIIMLGCLAATFSRGCWIGVAIAVAGFITFYNGKLWGLAIPVVLVLPFILPDNIMIRLLSIGNMEDTSTAIRIKIWLSSLNMGTDFMLTGAGLGTAAYAFLYPFYSYYYIPAHHSHNVFIQVLIEGGIIGLILFLFIIWRFTKVSTMHYIKNFKTSKDSSLMCLAFATGVLGFLIQGMFDYPFYNYRIVLIFWIFLAFGTSMANHKKKEGVA